MSRKQPEAVARYLASDATIHLECDFDRIGREGADPALVTVPASDLRTAQLREVDNSVQLVAQSNEEAAAQPFCFIRKVGAKTITSLKDLDEGFTMINRQGCLWINPCSTLADIPMTIEVSPFGIQSRTPASEKGWIYLERFVSMVKIAMVPEEHGPKIVFSNSQHVLQQILEGGQRMREAASKGQETLLKVLKDFEEELRQKRFAAISLDKAENAGGMGGMSGTNLTDADVVQGIMNELVQRLATHWQEEAQAQLQRQLLLSVNRSDATSVRAFLEAQADPNAKDALGMTSLHQAARCNSPEVVRTLLEFGANLSLKDRKGNCPAHEITLLSHSTTLELMDLLAPEEDVMLLNNQAGVSPLNRFRTWRVTELSNGKFPEAHAWADKIKDKYPARQRRTVFSSADTAAVACATETYTGPRGPFKVKVWQADSDVEVHVLCIGLSFLSPPSMFEDAFHTVAKHLCPKQNLSC